MQTDAKKRSETFNTLINITRYEKNQIRGQLSELQATIDRISEKISEVQAGIDECEKRMRGFHASDSRDIQLSNYELLRINLLDLSEKLLLLQNEEDRLNGIRERVSDLLKQKQFQQDKYQDRSNDYLEQHHEHIEKQIAKELEDLWLGLEWVKANA